MDDDVGRVFHALGDARRLVILDELTRSDGATATDLAMRVSISRQGVAKHLRVLADVGLVDSVRRGREVLYTANPRAMQRANAWLERRGQLWEQRLARLKRQAETDS